jgi:3-phosphoshikimate 1-carboxyvinyltransferase
MEEFFVLIEKRSSLRGEITVPGDKSISHRAIVFAAMAQGVTEIDGFLLSEDCISTIDCLRKMQIKIEILPNNKIRVHGKGMFGLQQPDGQLNTGRSGTAIRLMLGLLAGQQFNAIVTRAEAAQRKPLGKIVRSLKDMGSLMKGRDDNNMCPVYVMPGKLKGTQYDISMYDSYIKTSILVAGLYAEGITKINEPVKSRDHTERMMEHFGAKLNVTEKSVELGIASDLQAQNVEIPGDISLAAYFITAGMIVENSDITVKNIGINPTRAGILEVYKAMGANIEIVDERQMGNEPVADIRIKTSKLKATEVGGDIVVSLLDEIPIIAVAAAFAEGTTVIKDLRGFKIFESGKLKLMAVELSKMGVKVEETDDGLIITGNKNLRGTVIDSSNCYEVAMAMAVAGLAADGETTIRKAQILDIVYPEYINILNNL